MGTLRPRHPPGRANTHAIRVGRQHPPVRRGACGSAEGGTFPEAGMRGGGMRLRELQRWMASTIMRPLTADFRMPTDGNDKLLGVIDSLIAPSPKLSSLQRLEIYNRQYWFRLFDSLREDFPALVKLVGDTVFRGLAEDYLQRNPSHSFTLRNLGSRLSSWLQGLADQELRESESWHAGLRYPLQLLADVAALEWAYIEAFDSAEVPSLGGGGLR